MPQAVARKILTATWLLPQKLFEEVLEEGGDVHTWGRVDPIVGKHLAGRSKGYEVAIAADQESDTWTSMSTRSPYWDDEVLNEFWEDTSFYLGPWVAYVDESFGAEAYPLQPRNVAGSTEGVKFLYVGNVGDNPVAICTDGVSYDIIVDAKANFYTRLDSIDPEDVLIKQAVAGPGNESIVQFLAAI